MISQTAEYALRAVVCLAEQSLPKTTAELAEMTQIPSGYLAKVMQSLNRAGLVDSQRGLHGGFVLSIPAHSLTVLQVVNAVDPIRRFHQCPRGLHGIHLCPLHRTLDDAAKSVEESFQATTVAELNKVPQGKRPLCAFPMNQ